MYTAPLKAAFLFLSLSISTLALPTSPSLDRRANVLTTQTYNQFQVSTGIAGNALAEVNAKFPIDQTNLAAVSASDLSIISKAAQVSESAEVKAGGFNDAIAAAGATTAAGKALQVGKIKNKVLKLQTDVLRLRVLVAQGAADKQAQLEAQVVKLNSNVALDVKAAGQKSKAISFAG